MAASVVHRFQLPSRGFTHAEVLQVFDLLRRRVSELTSGTEAAFAGYDELTLRPLPDMESGHLLHTATLVSVTARRHVVAYEADYQPSEPGSCDSTARVIATARGHTVCTGGADQGSGMHW
jgi:hypothetical protein